MPDHVYAGPSGMTYPESRHADQSPVGTVEPGEIRDTDGPLDRHWREAAGEDRAARAKVLADREVQGAPAGEMPAGGPVMPGNMAGPALPPQPDRNRDYQVPPDELDGPPAPQPVPAPPAVIPPAS